MCRACLSCFVFKKGSMCNGKEIACNGCNRNVYGQLCYKNHLKVEERNNSVCKTVKKCPSCDRIITGKHVSDHKCGYIECNNCKEYVDNTHKCFLKNVEVKGGIAKMISDVEITNQLKRKIGVSVVDHILKNTCFMTLNVLKVLANILLT